MSGEAKATEAKATGAEEAPQAPIDPIEQRNTVNKILQKFISPEYLAYRRAYVTKGAESSEVKEILETSPGFSTIEASVKNLLSETEFKDLDLNDPCEVRFVILLIMMQMTHHMLNQQAKRLEQHAIILGSLTGIVDQIGKMIPKK